MDNYNRELFEKLKKDHDELILLCKQLLKGVDRCSHKPHYIVQPFLGIVIEHAEIINRLNLTDED